MRRQQFNASELLQLTGLNQQKEKTKRQRFFAHNFDEIRLQIK